MDLSKMPNDKKLNLCQWYFRAGFAFLPFVLTVNAIWFFDEAFRKPVYDEQKQIKKYVLMSAVGSLIWSIILVSWVTTFQLNRANWGEFADYVTCQCKARVDRVGCLHIIKPSTVKSEFLKIMDLIPQKLL